MSRCIIVALVGLGLLVVGTAVAAEPGAACLKQQIPKLLQEARSKPLAARPGFLIAQLIRRCPRLPLDLQLILYYDSRAPRRVRRLGRMASRSKEAHKLLAASWDKMCPGLTTRQFAKLPKLAANQMFLHVYKRCKGKANALLAKSELLGVSLPFFYGVKLFGGLLRLGVPEKAARRFTRRAYLAEMTFPSWRLLPLSSPFGFKYMNTLSIRARALSVNSRKVCDVQAGTFPVAIKEGKKASSPIIMPLLLTLASIAERQQRITRFNKAIQFRGHLLVKVSPDTPYRLMFEAFSTAYRAGFHKVLLLGRATKATPLSFLRVLPVSLKVPPKPGSGAGGDMWLFQWNPKGLFVQRGDKSAAVKSGCRRWLTGRPSALTMKGAGPKVLLKALQACIPRLKRLAPQIKKVVLAPAKDMTFKTLVRYLNALGYTHKGKLRVGPLTLQVKPN